MLYFVQPGDTLSGIARRFGTTVGALLEANVICNPNLIFVGQPLIIPRPGLDLPKAGGIPYYIVLPGDTLFCLARQFNTTVSVLAAANQIRNPNLIFVGSELLIIDSLPNPEELRTRWEETPGPNCEIFTPQLRGLHTSTFEWAALGRRAVPYLLNFLNHPCAEIRYYAVMALGRIALNGQVIQALNQMLDDPSVANLASIAIRRIQLAAQGRKRVHLLEIDNALHNQPLLDSPSVPLPAGTEIIVLRWLMPSPIGEAAPPFGIVIWDYVQVVQTGQVGFLRRLGDLINII